MKKIFYFIAFFAIASAMIFFALKENLNPENLILDFGKKNNLSITFNKESEWNFYPVIKYINNISIKEKNSFFEINDANINISKNYWPYSKININLISPLMKIKDVHFRNNKILSIYDNEVVLIKNISSNLTEGNIDLSGKIYINKDATFELDGSFKNISLNMILNQAKVAKWERVKLKLSSPNFNISGSTNNNKEFNKNLNGKFDINGSIFFVSTEEERFGAALLSLLTDKLPDLVLVSDTISFLITNFSNIPTSLKGDLEIKNGIISTDKILIKNNQGSATFTGVYNLDKEIIDGKISFFEDGNIFLEALLKGNIKNPEILVGGEILSLENSDAPQDIKKIFEEGLQNLVDKLLNIDD